VGGHSEAMEQLRRYSRLLSEHWSAQRTMPRQDPHPFDENSNSVSEDSSASVPLPVQGQSGNAQPAPHPHLPGTVRLSVLNGTSGIFIAKIRKKSSERCNS
jgi:hypothetical protein